MHKRLLIFLISSLIILGLPGFSECGSPSLSLNEENSVTLEKDEEKEGKGNGEIDVPESAKVSSELVFEKEMEIINAERKKKKSNLLNGGTALMGIGWLLVVLLGLGVAWLTFDKGFALYNKEKIILK